MSKRIYSIFLTLLLAVLSVIPASAQDGAFTGYTPYSVYGVGDLFRQGNAYSKSMGGVGIAGRDRRYINIVNPAAITARDTLSFMADASFFQNNSLFTQGNIHSANNTMNINNISISFPIWRKSAMSFGVIPYSSVGYDFSHRITDPEILGTAGSVLYSSSGTGGIYQIYGSAAATFWNRLSIGAQAIYYIGNIDKTSSMTFSSESYRGTKSGYTMSLNGFSGKFGLQYEQPIKDIYLTIGGTYKLSNKLGGHVTGYKYGVSSTKTDTLYHHVDTLLKSGKVRLASEIGVGISLRKSEKWSFELNWLHSGWSDCGLDATPGFANVGGTASAALPFSATTSDSFRAGFEYIPNRSDIRYYFRRCAYRVGMYYDTAYYKLDGNSVVSYGLTFGVTLPVFRFYNGVTLGVDIGRKGSVKGGSVKETYAGFVVGFNIHDIWFIKPRYN